MTQRLVVYPGSFDPLHHGHLDIVHRCLPLFDELLIAVLRNEEKRPLFSIQERVDILREQVDGNRRVRVESFSGLLVDFVEQVGAVAIVRGLRALSDFDYEFQMALMNRRLNARVETVFMMPKEEYSYVSSRLVKEVFFLGGDVSALVPAPVLARMQLARAARQAPENAG
ncbi:MAG: pantetheine-phosphate adenylyltransferase [Acidobacteriota bacterium]